ncbi:MAG: tetratricopeptide repeat protein [Treponema sp.]|jgi:putative GTP pyrophosphokinase|nr:tetratricopeptide repeat protein [Treponema sp.]
MGKTKLPNQTQLKEIYDAYLAVRVLVTKDLEQSIEKALCPMQSHPTVKGRVKEFDSFYKKYLGLLKKGGSGLLITDLVGIRVICPFFEDIFVVENVLKQTFEVVEVERKGSNYSFKEFGYESTHLLIKLPSEVREQRGDCGIDVVEVQIRTILQDAWAEVEHELVYKAEFTPFDEPMKRKIAALNANLFLADTIFQEIREHQRKLNGELGKRRGSFFKKVEESTDRFLFVEETLANIRAGGEQSDLLPTIHSSRASIDELLLNALYAHNRNQFEQAITFYTRILELHPDNTVCSLIYKHRGMANFARSHYEDAITDFTQALELDPSSYKAPYYRGIVKAILQRFSEAIDDFSLSLTMNAYQPFCLYRRGQAYYHVGDLLQALTDCESALKLEPNCESVLKFKEFLLEKLKM